MDIVIVCVSVAVWFVLFIIPRFVSQEPSNGTAKTGYNGNTVVDIDRLTEKLRKRNFGQPPS